MTQNTAAEKPFCQERKTNILILLLFILNISGGLQRLPSGLPDMQVNSEFISTAVSISSGKHHVIKSVLRKTDILILLLSSIYVMVKISGGLPIFKNLRLGPPQHTS